MSHFKNWNTRIQIPLQALPSQFNHPSYILFQEIRKSTVHSIFGFSTTRSTFWEIDKQKVQKVPVPGNFFLSPAQEEISPEENPQ